MTKEYICDLCKKVFNQKIDFTRHRNKKAPCITLDELQQISQTKEVKMDNKTRLISVFKNCLNILRDNEGLTGEKALRTMSYLLILKLLEPHFGGEIDIDNYAYDFSHIEDEMIFNHKKKLLEIVRFTNLSNENEDNIPVNMKYLWDDILSNHPTTRNIFLKGKGFDIQHKSTYKKLIDKLISLDLSQTEYDVLGNAYEEVIQDIMTGKVLGQFFTQPLIKKMMVKLIDPQIYSDGTIDTCGDPTMGTGGFLITYLQYILQQANTKNINPNWEFIKTEGLYGKELEPDTYQLAVSNMLISSGHMFEKLDRGDSIREPITRKFDNILANPPYGIKGLKYDDFQSPLKCEYIPIKTDNAVSLFIQAIIYMLKINGKCAVVLPDGQDLFSKTNKSLIAIREYLMKTCDLKEIIYLPSGIFTYTSIKTCVFYFIKKRDGNDVLETKIKISRTQKETSREYKFSKTHQTTKVKFYDYNPYEDIKNLLVEVPIENISNNSYSLNYAEYIKDETEEPQYCEDVIIKTLGEVCEVNQGNSLTKTEMIDGIYDVIGGGKIIGKHNDKNRDGNDFTLTRVGDININYINKPYYLTDNGFSLKSKQDDIMTKYIYYLLSHNKDYLTNLYQGTAQKVISKTNLKELKIPIPSIERQQEIVKYLDFIYEKANKTSNEKIAELKQLNEFCLNNQKTYGENVVKTLGEVCEFDIGGTPSRNKNEYYENGNNLWVSVRELNGGYIYDTKEKLTDLGVKNSSVKLFAKDTILFSFKLSIGKTAIVGNPLYTNEAIAGIISKNNDILNNRYLYYYLTINDYSKLGSGMLGNGSLNKKSIEQLKISIPSIEKQKEIVEYCEHNDMLINQLEKEIENNKKQAQLFINNIKSNINLENEIVQEEIV
jgi:type I restriction-modification system DNA methylase subunit/restriction endonuclease S subunit